MNITPQKISALKPNEVFVFGSNLQGNHAGGAARFAVMKFGAEMGNGVGPQGQSYAIPTLGEPAMGQKSLDELKLPINEIGAYVKQFINYAAQHQDQFFYVTPIGCGIAGFNESEIAPLFQDCLQLDNVALPETFFQYYNEEEPQEDEENYVDVMQESSKIRMTESQFNRMVYNSVNSLLKEYYEGIGNYDSANQLMGYLKQVTELNNSVIQDENIDEMVGNLMEYISNRYLQ